MKRTIMLLGILAGAAASVGAQQQTKYAPSDTQKTFFKRSDLVVTGIALGASAALSPFDKRIAHWWQSPDVHGDSSRHDLANSLTVVNETPLTIGFFAVWGIGKLAHNETMADVGLHTTEALVITVGLAEAIRGPLGRKRPRESENDQYNFKFWGGFTEFDRRSYPSIHAAVAFATATSLVGELKLRKPESVKYAAPVLYTAAMIPGLTRMYLNQHWASDIVAGSVMGALIGSRVVSYGHSHHNKVDRMLASTFVSPDGRGNTLVGLSFDR